MKDKTNRKILYNAIKTPDGTILHSKNRHDYITYIDKNGYEYMVDGGNDYLRRNVVKEAPHKDISVYDDGKHETRREVIYWGVNYDKDMNKLSETLWKPIKYLNIDHIQAILDGGYAKNNSFYLEIFEEELKYRKT